MPPSGTAGRGVAGVELARAGGFRSSDSCSAGCKRVVCGAVTAVQQSRGVGSALAARPGLVDSSLVEPVVDSAGIEADQMAELDVRDAAFGNETSDVPDADAEPLGDSGDINQRVRSAVTGGHGCACRMVRLAFSIESS